MDLLERLGNGIWDPWLLGGFLLAGLWCSAGTGFFQLFGWRRWLGTTAGSLLRPRRRNRGQGLTQLHRHGGERILDTSEEDHDADIRVQDSHCHSDSLGRRHLQEKKLHQDADNEKRQQ